MKQNGKQHGYMTGAVGELRDNLSNKCHVCVEQPE